MIIMLDCLWGVFTLFLSFLLPFFFSILGWWSRVEIELRSISLILKKAKQTQAANTTSLLRLLKLKSHGYLVLESRVVIYIIYMSESFTWTETWIDRDQELAFQQVWSLLENRTKWSFIRGIVYFQQQKFECSPGHVTQHPSSMLATRWIRFFSVY